MSAPTAQADPGIAPPAALMADPARAAMLTALLDGRPLAAGELARVAGVSPATASSHLFKLLHGGLVTAVRQGRHRYYRLTGHDVAAAIEALSQLAGPPRVRSLRASREAAALGRARTCYDHLAGRAGVALLDALLARGVLVPAVVHARGELAREAFCEFEVSEPGHAELETFGIGIPELKRTRRRFAGACLDWTERRPHLNGALGAAITGRLLAEGWIERGAYRRAVRVTPAGRDGLARTFGVVWDES